MIKRIKSVKDFRCYQGWKEHPDAVDYEKLNLIHAANGTGKSTFAELLSGVPGDENWSHGMRVVIQPGDESTIETVTGPGHWYWGRVRLFNADYVRRNLRFDAEDDDTGAPALMYLGRENIEHRLHREQAQAEIARITTDQKALNRQKTKEENKRLKFCTDLARRAIKDLQSANGTYRPGFDRRHVIAALDRPLTPLDELEPTASQDLALLHGTAWKPVDSVATEGLADRSLWEECSDLMSKTVVSQVLDELRSAQDHEAWVHQGMKLHDDRGFCLFCGGEIPEGRIERLQLHFDEGYTLLQSRIDAVLGEIAALRDLASHFPGSLPRPGEVYEDLRSDLTEAVKRAEASANELVSNLDRLAAALREKKGQMFGSLLLPAELSPTSVDASEVDRVLEKHNGRVRERDTLRAQAADRQFQRMLHEIVTPVNEHLREEAGLRQQITTHEESLKQHRAVLGEVPPEGLDPEHLLRTLNEDIARLLRRDELSFEHRDGQYRVLRHREPARHLSEGEKTAIALLYFLQSLEERGREPSSTVVVVDDPVSSLDDELMFGVYSTLITRLDPEEGKCRQLFVLTHSTAFLRHWGKDLKRKDTSSTLHLMKSRRTAEGRRSPVLVPTDPKGSKAVLLETEYLFLFHTVADTLLRALNEPSLEADLALATSTPNQARKIMEHFLQFKSPKQGINLTNAVEVVLKDHPALAARIIRFVHSGSHRSADPNSVPLTDPTVREDIAAVFTMMRKVDAAHFEGTCHRLGLTDQMDQISSP